MGRPELWGKLEHVGRLPAPQDRTGSRPAALLAWLPIAALAAAAVIARSPLTAPPRSSHRPARRPRRNAWLACRRTSPHGAATPIDDPSELHEP